MLPPLILSPAGEEGEEGEEGAEGAEGAEAEAEAKIVGPLPSELN